MMTVEGILRMVCRAGRFNERFFPLGIFFHLHLSFISISFALSNWDQKRLTDLKSEYLNMLQFDVYMLFSNDISLDASAAISSRSLDTAKSKWNIQKSLSTMKVLSNQPSTRTHSLLALKFHFYISFLNSTQHFTSFNNMKSEKNINFFQHQWVEIWLVNGLGSQLTKLITEQYNSPLCFC